MKLICLYAVMALSLAACQNPVSTKHDLLQAKWQFKQSTDSVWLNAVVPGAVQLDLISYNKLPDPFIGTNEDSIRWVEQENWDYKGVFNLTAEILEAKHIALEFAGLDTYAEVKLNGYVILSSTNMFRTYRVDITNVARAGENVLEVGFTSPLNQNRQLYKSTTMHLPAGSETGAEQVSPFTRKAAYQFGWDFAPRIVTMGIWRPIYVSSWSLARIVNMQFVAEEITPQQAKYSVFIEIERAHEQELALNLNGTKTQIKLKKGFNRIKAPLIIEEPRFWWPSGMGEAALYGIKAELWYNDKRIDAKTENLGIRTIELIREKDEIGESFYFKINDKPVFMKGANWSPLSSYPAAIPDSVYHNRIAQVKAANMNMLRVWGGGIYESDLFYELCDKNGILVWQDFMFANSMYPSDTVFLNNIAYEITEQLIRLRNHPSLALWNGNNEIEVAWKNWGWQKQFGYSAKDSAALWKNYLSIFHDKIPRLIARYDPQRSYTPTSPLSNWGTPENFNTGSMHYWGVWHGNDDFDDFKANTGRFMAEYGFQSYPATETFEHYYPFAEFRPDSNAYLHQKSYVGNKHILRESRRYFGEAENTEQFLLFSQLTQAIGLKKAIEAHRLANYKCGGTLFWQLNDCWPGPNWSVIDFYGNTKIAYEVVKDRYRPTILIPVMEGTEFSVHVVNDQLSDINGTFRIEMFKSNSNRLWVLEKPVRILQNQSKVVYKSHPTKLLDGMPADNVYLKITLLNEAGVLDSEKYYFVAPKLFKGSVDFIGID